VLPLRPTECTGPPCGAEPLAQSGAGCSQGDEGASVPYYNDFSGRTMTSANDLPQRDAAHDTADAAEAAFRVAIKACKHFVVQREDRNDYGTDVQIEARRGKAMTNIRGHVQLKGTGRPANANGSVSLSIARTNLNYLLAQADSIYVCYHLPSQRLLVRYADDVYREYEHRGANWTHQETVTVNLTHPFDEGFQRRLNARLLASGESSRDRRLLWAVTPPERIPPLVERATPIINVPAEPEQASKVLTELYESGHDAAISGSFEQFAAVLDPLPGAMDLAYMAEINLGINGFPFDKDRVRRAIRVLESAMGRGGLQPGSLLYCLGNASLALQEYEKARDVYRAALLRLNSPESRQVAAQCCKNLGSALERFGDNDEAGAVYERALELDPDLGEAHLALALWHRRKGGDLNIALEHLDQVLPREDSALRMSALQGWRIDLLFRTGDTGGAFREITSLLGQASQLDWVWPWCAREVGQFGKGSAETAQKALRFWRAYLREHPKDRGAEREQLLCLWRIRAAESVTEINFNEFKRAVTQLITDGDPDPAFLWDRVGHWAQYDKDWEEAEDAYRKAYELEPTRYGYCLGTALNFLGRYREALPILLSQAEEHQPNAMSWFQVAVANEGVGDIKGSISAYRRALEIDSDYDLAWFNLGGVYWNSRDVARATETWREAVSRFPDHEQARTLRRNLPFLFAVNPDQPGG
jgi:tetratricopeptide (TPR) repeat protein